MNLARLGHKAISASAGSGKTFQLAHRYIELMARGVTPDRIIALTFSRKAAGEIFDSVVTYLCQAASSPEAARRTGVLINRPDAGRHEFLHILRELLATLHRLHIGTLDSFTVRVAKTFPLELGIPPGFQLLVEEGDAGGVRQEVLTKVFGQRGTNREERDSFREAYKQATFGREEKSLETGLEKLIKEKRAYYQVLPDAAAWGREDKIWAASPPWWQDPRNVEDAAGRLIDALQEDGLPDGAVERWRSFAEAVRRYGPRSTWLPPMKYLFDKLAEGIQPLRDGGLTLTVDRKRQRLTSEECRLALVLMAHVLRTEMTVVLQKTQGIYRVLDLYEQSYDAMMRQHGRLTYSDIQYLLTTGNRSSGGAVISRLPHTEARLYVDYRLDCQLDHWLLDEFQDTSDLQWEVLRNLADEILQDSSGQRSFFYVGDTKQAIYSWRGGNARLFGRILDRYRGQIELRRLGTSFRSCQAIIDTVNAAFGNLPEGELPVGAIRQWETAWQTHQCEEGAVPATGYAAILEPPSDQAGAKPSDEDRYRVVARLLQEIDPLRKRLSTAILVRRNESGEDIVDYLRRECSSMRIIHEGRASIRDNPVVSVLRSLVQFAAHPGDTYAWRHLEMSPLQQYFASHGLERHNLPPLLLRKLQADGFQSLIREWGHRLDQAHPLDDFGRKRLEELTNAAIEFDRDGDRDCNSFLRFIDSYETHDLAASEAIRVMTIHQSKGLGFDIVVLPDLQGESMVSGGQTDFAVARDSQTEEPAWALQMPRRIVAEVDDILREQLRIADETAAFDALCRLYVAMTRAKQGLYIITSFQGKTSDAFTPAAFLKQQLTGDRKRVDGKVTRIAGEQAICLYESGDPQWHAAETEALRATTSGTVAQLPPDFSQRTSRRRRLVHVQPSKRPETAQKASLLFAPDARDARDVGTAVHELFKEVSWIDDVDAEALIAKWAESSWMTDDLKQKAIALFRRAIAAAEIRSVLTKPPGNLELWQERRFEVVDGKRWVSGAFDRVVVSRNERGRAVGATVMDFKSDEVLDAAALEELARQYRPQMEAYRGALSRMLGLQAARIALALVFVQAGRVLEIR